MSEMAAVTLVLPGLKRELETHETGNLKASIPALETALSRGGLGPVNGSDLISTLFSLFHVPVQADEDWPSAAICRLADSPGEVTDGWYMRCDPVFLRPDRTRLLMFGTDILDLQQQEIQTLIQELNDHFAPHQHWHFSAPHPNRWYLRLDRSPGLSSTTAPSQLIGLDIHDFLPQGRAATFWRQIQNEIQMLLYASPVNQARERAGKPTVNSLWFWGAGALPSLGGVSNDWQTVWSDNLLAKGLAALSTTCINRLPGSAQGVLQGLQGGRQLVVLDKALEALLHNEIQRWSQELESIDQQWVQPLLAALRTKKIEILRILLCDGNMFELRTNWHRKFWRRRRSVDYILNSIASATENRSGWASSP